MQGEFLIVSPLHGCISHIHSFCFSSPLCWWVTKKRRMIRECLNMHVLILCIYCGLKSCFDFDLEFVCISILLDCLLVSRTYIGSLVSRAHIAYSFDIIISVGIANFQLFNWYQEDWYQELTLHTHLKLTSRFCIHLVSSANIVYLYDYYVWYHTLTLHMY